MLSVARASGAECGAGAGAGPRAGAGARGRLSAAVPDVAMAPNANTHLLTARDYFRLAPWGLRLLDTRPAPPLHTVPPHPRPHTVTPLLITLRHIKLNLH